MPHRIFNQPLLPDGLALGLVFFAADLGFLGLPLVAGDFFAGAFLGGAFFGVNILVIIGSTVV
ncbi:NADH-quinone oxidoreductase subunit 14 (NADH dehydrogenase I chain 14) (NDH-1 subunit 14) (fragment) [Vibrio atlanticus]|uniref:NADH-quinone oxidoreductase subunit 14 (NADH dehydrogenase I chain 14) (NDH-1 subunit 14) n=1 Tax=Vibrio atlanticus (strain LGP32) TaxID=575788 RepID=B7VJL8_VIBA3